MSKIAIVTDLHFGVRKDDKLFQKKQIEWINNQFLPTIDKYNIKTVINMGDTFDNRLNVNINTFNVAYNMYHKPLKDRGVIEHIILGNHDVYYKDTNRCNMLNVINDALDNVILVQDDLHTITINDKVKFVLCPWINVENHDKLINDLDSMKSRDSYLLGHFQITGIPIIGGLCQHGLEQSVFHGWKQVLSGHFHNPSQTNNIWYTGNPFYFTWADCGLNKGFVLYDIDADEFEHIATKDVVYHNLTLKDCLDSLKTLSEDFREQIIRIEVNGILDNKKSLESVLEAFSKGNNVVEVIEIGLDDESNLLESVKDTNNNDMNSPEFINSIIDESGVDDDCVDDVKSYMQRLLEDVK